MACVYILENRINHKCYVGQTIQAFKKRLEHHRDHKDCKMIITRAIKKYGIDSFNKHIFYLPIELLDHFEIEMIKRLNSQYPNGYNLESGGNKNKIMSDYTRLKMSINKRGKQSETHRESIKKLWRNPEYRKHMSDVHKGRPSKNKGKYKYPVELECKNCHNKFERNVEKGETKRKFCSRKCCNIYYSGDNNPSKRAEIRLKISKIRKGRTNKLKGKIIAEREIRYCLACGKIMIKRKKEKTVYCSKSCAKYFYRTGEKKYVKALL